MRPFDGLRAGLSKGINGIHLFGVSLVLHHFSIDESNGKEASQGG